MSAKGGERTHTDEDCLLCVQGLNQKPPELEAQLAYGSSDSNKHYSYKRLTCLVNLSMQQDTA